jgi:hypothetical protein
VSCWDTFAKITKPGIGRNLKRFACLCKRKICRSWQGVLLTGLQSIFSYSQQRTHIITPVQSHRLRIPDRGGGDLEIFIADVASSPPVLGKKRSMVVKSWSTVADVKSSLALRLNVPKSTQRLFFRDVELKNTHSLQDVGVCRSGELLTWCVVDSANRLFDSILLEPCGASRCPKRLHHSLLQGKRSLLLGKVPVLTLEVSRIFEGKGSCQCNSLFLLG